MNFSESFLFASMFWGAIGSGYLVYGWKQRSMYPFAAGLLISIAACFFGWFSLTVFSIILICGVWWLLKQGY